MDVIEPPVQPPFQQPPNPAHVDEAPRTGAPAAAAAAQNRPGQLTSGWKSVFIGGWVAVMAGFGAIAQGGRIAGISPWWLGPESDPKIFYIIAVPFLAPVVVISLAAMGNRFSCFVGILAAIGTAAISLGDLRWPGLAIGEATIGVAALAISAACLAGRYRRPPSQPAEPHAQPAEPQAAEPQAAGAD
jgi:hypothetical protein